MALLSLSLPPADEVHLWKIRHSGGQETLLCEAERSRLNRFHLAKDRQRYLATQSAKRLILARYLAQPPESLQLGENASHKPTLPGLEFNLSHTAGLSLLAVATTQAVGVDLEKIPPNTQLDLPALAERILSKAELAAYQALPEPARASAFYQLWTAKEAALKALGIGFQCEPHEIETDFPSLTQATLQGHPTLALQAIALGPDHLCHLASASLFRKTHLFDLSTLL